MRLALTRRIKPGALQAGDLPVEVGDSGDQRRQGLRLAGHEIPVVAAGMEAQDTLMRGEQNAAAGKISSASVPAIGCDMANRRRAAWGEPRAAAG
ncbi:hypothetical protein MesoLjLa_67450 (plasmid) [Mesorhizobium sp. L-2-11]|nr:hypothetical protein MesoLjLa_67450 [Mesorhizobium sp. L-2-11]